VFSGLKRGGGGRRGRLVVQGTLEEEQLKIFTGLRGGESKVRRSWAPRRRRRFEGGADDVFPRH
jgi:hypothetical protein